jgi:hypothetical protein
MLGSPIRKSWVQRLLASTPGISQLATSFFGIRTKPFTIQRSRSFWLGRFAYDIIKGLDWCSLFHQSFRSSTKWPQWPWSSSFSTPPVICGNELHPLTKAKLSNVVNRLTWCFVCDRYRNLSRIRLNRVTSTIWLQTNPLSQEVADSEQFDSRNHCQCNT